MFQATPPVINSGGSSTLTWCPVAGEIYRLSPGPGIVTGGTASVSPTVTTVYTLTASNALGIVTNFTTVIVNPCGFASVSNWDATLTFSYTLAPSAPGFSFRHQPPGTGHVSIDAVWPRGIRLQRFRVRHSPRSMIGRTIRVPVRSSPPRPLASARPCRCYPLSFWALIARATPITSPLL